MSTDLSRRRWLSASASLLGTSLLGTLPAWLSGCATTPSSGKDSAPPAKPLKIGLVLGGGGARGFAHVGIIKVLEAQGIFPDVIVGTSAGSVVGSLYASGINAYTLQQIAQNIDESDFADWTLPLPGGKSGVLKGEALQNYMNKLLSNRSIEQMPRKLGIVATDLQSGEPILFERGNIGMAVRASASVPGVFQPVSINGRQYVDGGLVAPVPVHYARQLGADFVIAVNITSDPLGQDVRNSLGVLWQTTSIMSQSINQHELAMADVVLRPQLGKVGTADFAARHQSILAGEAAATQEINTLRQKLAAAKQKASSKTISRS